MIITFTGHRDLTPSGKIVDAVGQALNYFDVTEAWCGMAVGFDLLAGMIADNRGIQLNLAYIYSGTKAPVTSPWHQWFNHLSIKHSDRIHVTNEDTEYKRWLPLNRNIYMLDRSEAVIAFWGGSTKGGTWHTVNEASKRKMPIVTIDPVTSKVEVL